MGGAAGEGRELLRGQHEARGSERLATGTSISPGEAASSSQLPK